MDVGPCMLEAVIEKCSRKPAWRLEQCIPSLFAMNYTGTHGYNGQCTAIHSDTIFHNGLERFMEDCRNA